MSLRAFIGHSWRASALASVLLLLACGDDPKSPSVGTGRDRDAGSDASTDATMMDPDGNVDESRPPPPDAGHDARVPPPPADAADDGQAATTCAIDCELLSTQCAVAFCNEQTLECELTAVPDGTACGSQALNNCTAPDTCQAGLCEPNHAPANTPCGDRNHACRLDDACDGNGVCVDNGLRPVGTACGNPASSECDAPDSCNAQGDCAPNYAAADAPCGDQDAACRFDDACDGNGTCVDGGIWQAGACPPGTTQNSDGRCICGRSGPISTCLPGPDVCDDDGACIPGHEYYAAGSDPESGEYESTDGNACGSATDNDCDNPDSCSGGVCAPNTEPALTQCNDNPTSIDPTADTVCNGRDSCDGFGNCLSRYAGATTICGEPAGECFAAPRCNGNGSCASALAALPGTACGDPTVRACDGADVCDGFGNCAEGFDDAGTHCGSPPMGACDVQDVCDGAGQCDEQVAAAGTPCGNAGHACRQADACNDSGACVAGTATVAGTPCGDPSSSDCDLPDSCNGAGACASNPVAAGVVCGGAPGICEMQDTCSGAGSCADNGFTLDCEVTVTGRVVTGDDDDPVANVTVEVLGSAPSESAITDGAGTFAITVPAGRPYLLRVHSTPTHWGLVWRIVTLPTDTTLLGSIVMPIDEDVSEFLAAPGLNPVDDSLAVLVFEFSGASVGGGEAVQIAPTCAPSACGPMTLTSQQQPAMSSVLLAGGLPVLTFINLPPGVATATATGAAGVNTCSVPTETWPVFPRTITQAHVACAPP